mgnify:FL=1
MTTPDQWLPGQLLQQAREYNGLSKAEAARRSGLSESWWRRLETGINIRNGQKIRVTATPEALAKAAQGVNLPVNQIFEAAGLETTTPTNLSDEITTEAKRLPSHLQREALAFIRGLTIAARQTEE